MTEQKYL